MKHQVLPSGLSNGPLNDVLPAEFDFDQISSFFQDRENRETLRDGIPNAAKPDAPVIPAQHHTAAADIETPLFPETDDTPTDLLPDAVEHARSGLENASAHAATDLASHARPLREWSDRMPDPVDPATDDGAGAKPNWANGGDTTDGDTTTVKGRGKNKDKTTTDGTDTGGTTDTGGGTTDTTGGTGGTDTGGTDTGGTDTGGTTGSDIYVSGLDTPGGYNISIDFAGDWTASLRQAVVDAAEFISDIVVGDLPDVNGIDDLHITASLTSIDGSGGYFGWGGYTSTRSDSHLASSGYLRLDTADLATMETYGVVDDFAFHEILHAMGFGTAWNAMGLVQDFSGDLRFIGDNATEAYNAVFGDIAAMDELSVFGVPVETDGGSGTAGVHWDHATFGSEIMTGTLRVDNVTSDMTIAALEDMGYDTIYEPGALLA